MTTEPPVSDTTSFMSSCWACTTFAFSPSILTSPPNEDASDSSIETDYSQCEGTRIDCLRGRLLRDT